MTLTGKLLIAGEWIDGREPFSATDPASGRSLEPMFASAGDDAVALACQSAMGAFGVFAAADLEVRAGLLERIAEEILALGDELLERGHAETGLPLARLTNERGRTVGQLRLFAAEVRDRGWMGVRIDPALPKREPLPRVSHATMNMPLGPVAVFGASNFPLAFSVAGGDTASALAAGCPVVVKGHPAHPGTSELVASAIAKAVAAVGLPAGVFSLLQGPSHEIGRRLVMDPNIRAVGFTGSRQGGVALMQAAAERPEPIPVYAEMSAVNPVVLLPGALEEKAEELAAAFVGSLTMGAGQFCTNPGLILAPEGASLERFTAGVKAALAEAGGQTMLTSAICMGYRASAERLAARPEVDLIAKAPDATGENQAVAGVFSVSAADFDGRGELAEEIFGPTSLIVRHPDVDAMRRTVESLEGQLTTSVHFTKADKDDVRALTPALARIAGRVIANGWPTGVEVCHAMVHGGPFPATSDGRTTSVGTLAIERFLRPVCFQNFADDLLPDPLQPGGAQGALRRLDGTWTMS